MQKSKSLLAVLTIATLSALLFVVRAAGAGQDATQGAAQSSNAVVTPAPQKVADGEFDAKRLLLLMDTDKNGKVSKQEFMAYMEAEFDRLDKDKNGYLDVNELTKAKMRSVAGGHR